MKKLDNIFGLLVKHKTKIIIITLVLVIFGLVHNFFWNDISVFIGIKEGMDNQKNYIEVSVVRIKKKDVENKIDVMGTISYKEKASISSKILGRIEKLYVEQGDYIKKGSQLAKIETLPLEMQLKSARAELRSSRAIYQLSKEKLGQARRNIERQFKAISKSKIDLRDKYISYKNMKKVLGKKKKLYKIGGVTETELDSLKTSFNNYLTKYLSSKKDYEILNIGYRNKDLKKGGYAKTKDKGKKKEQLKKLNTKVEKAEAEAAFNNMKKVSTTIDILKTNISEAWLRSPIDGVVAARNIEIGEKVRDDTTLFVIMNVYEVYLVANINEKQITSLKRLQDVKFTVDAVKDTKFMGEVRLISPILDVATRTIEVKILVSNWKKLLRPGMFARAIIHAGTFKDLVCVPKKAIKDISDNTGQVFIYKDGAVYRKKIEIGRKFEDEIEITSGLDAGETIVLDNLKLLTDGMKVSLKKLKPEKNIKPDHKEKTADKKKEKK